MNHHKSHFVLLLPQPTLSCVLIFQELLEIPSVLHSVPKASHVAGDSGAHGAPAKAAGEDPQEPLRTLD